MEEQSSCEAAGINGMWWLKFSKDDPESVLTSSDIAGLFCLDQTLLCHNALDSIVTQVTSTSVRLVCLRSRKLRYEWKPPQSHNIIHASATDTEISYLFCGTANGSVVYFLLHPITGDLTGMKTLSFGMRPVTLELIAHNNTRKVFISSDQPAIIYSLSKNLHISSVNRKGVNRICSFSTPNVPSGLVIASEDRLTLEALGDMKIDVSSVYLHEQPLCIAYQRQSQTFTVACVKYSELSETSNIYLFDERTFGILDTYRLEPSSFGVVYGVSLLSCVFSGDNQEYVCVGTTSFDGRIKVLVIRQGRRLELVSQTSVFYGGPLFSLTAFSGMLLAGSGREFVIFKWDAGERTLQKVYQYQAAGEEYASCLQFLGNSIYGGKLPQLMHFTVHSTLIVPNDK